MIKKKNHTSGSGRLQTPCLGEHVDLKINLTQRHVFESLRVGTDKWLLKLKGRRDL